MLILFIIVLGMAAGWAASLITGIGRGNWPLLFTAGLGGSFVGGLLASLVTSHGLDVHATGLIGSIVGAIVVLAVVALVKRGDA